MIDGTKIAAAILADLSSEIQTLEGRPPALAFILVGKNPASLAYIMRKQKKCEEIGITSVDRIFEKVPSPKELHKTIDELNRDPNIDGILLQLPLPSPLNADELLSAIDPAKDVDGFHPLNMGKLLLGDDSGFTPCTPLGITALLMKMGIQTKGKHAVIVGRSNIVGKPLAALLVQNQPGGNATVTIAHRHTKNLSEITRTADILIVAVGSPNFIKADMVKPGATVIDVGINRTENGITGDVDFGPVSKVASQITPVPGGVGPMTIAMLLSNTLKSRLQR